MSVYLYIAQSNPDNAYQICQNHGFYDVQSIDELAQGLETIVAQNGEESLK